VADSSATGIAAASPATGAGSPATGTAATGTAATGTAATGTADAPAGTTDTASMDTASAIGGIATGGTATGGTATGGTDCPATGLLATAAAEVDELDHNILDAMIKLFRQILAQSERLAERHGVPLFCVKALHILDTSMAMKELGQRMGCDPSFVTAIADTLEKRGLAKREASAADRRVKNLVLSTEGVELKGQIEKEMLVNMPWSNALDTAERETFLTLILKLVDAEATSRAIQATGPATGVSRPTNSEAAMPADPTASSPAMPTVGGRAGEVSDAPDTASAATAAGLPKP